MRALTLAPARTAFEVRGYFRQVDTVFFTFLFPVIFLVIFSSIFSEDISVAGLTGDGPASIPAATYYLPGLIAAGLLLSGVQNLAIDIALEKGDGRLKRLGGTPMSPVTYFLGKLGQVLVTGTCQVTLLLLVASLAFGVDLPTDPGRWLTFAWVYLLGLLSCALVGVALSALPRSGRSASAVVIPVVVVLQFISGVYVADFQLPDGVRTIAAAFPLAWMARGMRSVFLPEEMQVLERGGEWGPGQVALALTVWLVLGFVVSRLTFRWLRRDA
ncbi:ABC transporter permease [Litorihabitans aurantiacus]|uniref:Transport permease protein n=1 Tax=Litorihabitans aurantiacus TaxID=1930061 RepID=A0AA38CTV0_9MICO|nr:ABC transporter permease [Litorihabitans aurantiacus]GMA32142.1 transport permease protein [Litorihabitans aurantiacus]